LIVQSGEKDMINNVSERATVTTEPLKVPGPSGAPLLGNSRALLKDNLGFVIKMAREYGDVVRYKMGPMPVYQVNHPDGVQHILQDNNRNYGKDTLNLPFVTMLLGNGLVTSDGDLWLRQRRLMQPAFHHRHVAALVEQMSQATLEMLAGWQPEAASGEPLDIAEEMMSLTLNIVNQALFTSQVSDETEAIRDAMAFLAEDMAFRFQLPFYPPPFVPTLRNRRFKKALATLDQTIQGIIDGRREILAAGEAGPQDLLGQLMEARDEETGEGMDDRQLRDEVITMFIAGHETTALALSWAWYLLATHPEAERKLHDELSLVLDDRVPTAADLPALPYTRMVIDETVRLYPPAWISNRQSINEDVVCGYRIPAKSFVAFSPYVTHRNPELWPDPERFDPERFANGQGKERPRYAYFPFGGGPRQCIGKGFALVEAQLILATVAQRYRLRLAPGHEVRPTALMTLRPKGGLPMTLERRSGAK
jgi:cytochrome P450